MKQIKDIKQIKADKISQTTLSFANFTKENRPL